MPAQADDALVADRPAKRARWSCLLDADGSRRWVIEGCAAEIAHRTEGGEVLGAAPSLAVLDGEAAPYIAQAHADQVLDVDIAYGSRHDDAYHLNFGFDEAEPTFGDEDQDEAFDLPPVPVLDSPPGEDTGRGVGHEPPPTSASPSTSAVAPLGEADGAAVSSFAAAGVGVKRRRLSVKTSPTRAAELGHRSPPAEERGEEELVTQGAAAAARARNRGILSAHRHKVKAARSRAWEAVARQPDLAAVAVGQDAAEAPSEDLGVAMHGAPTVDLTVPRCWNAHVSHDVSAPSRTLLFCRRCGAWSAGHCARGLAAACRGAVGHKGNIRLLSLGIAPVRGARIPTELKLAGSRGTRGGSATKGTRRRRRPV